MLGWLVCGNPYGESDYVDILGQESAAEGLVQAERSCLCYAALGLMPSYRGSSALANVHGREGL